MHPERTDLDAIDVALVTALQDDARMSNKAMAAKVGVAPSTCWYRIRSLQERGVIRGFYTDVDHRALGYQTRAVVAIRPSRDEQTLTRRLRALPGVQHLYVMNTEVLVDVAAPDVPALQRLIATEVRDDPAIATSAVSLVTDTIRGAHRWA
jgi:DNA-binding Lrp family transcriptional regulator